MDAKTIIAELGGPTKVSRLLGVPFTTVVGWNNRNKIPHWRKDAEDTLRRAVKALPASQ